MNLTYVIPFQELRIQQIPQVGGKNASLGEMIHALSEMGVRVPDGFATTADAFGEFLTHDDLDSRINNALKQLNVEDVDALKQTGKQIRDWIKSQPFPPALEQAIRDSHQDLCANQNGMAVAVRSSATAEDLPDASFAGQQETYLNVRGIERVLHSVKDVFASLYNDRAIAYRVHQGFEHQQIALSAGVQKMVRSDIGAAGVMFTIDTESGFKDAVFITGAYGLGETVVQGAVNTDEFYVYKKGLIENRPALLRRTLGSKAIKMIYAKDGQSVQTVDSDEADRQRFCLSTEQVETLARHAIAIETHYGRAMDIEWALDGEDNELYIVQARPETVESRNLNHSIDQFELKETGELLISGRAIGKKIGTGICRVIATAEAMNRVQAGDVLVTDMTDPDWEPVMKKAAAIVTNRGGRTCHAAIIARELGIPTVVGCGDATDVLNDEQLVTVSCAEGETGNIYAGKLAFDVSHHDLDELPVSNIKLMMNVANPEMAFQFSNLPNDGIGLARLEFIINNTIGVHPKALIHFDQQSSDIQSLIKQRMIGHKDPVEFYVRKLSEGIATLAASVYPKPAIVRLSDFKSNEYANLIGGEAYEPVEENPMIGFRGAARYISKDFRDCFELECQAINFVRNNMGLDNVQVMIPFVRTLHEAKTVIQLLAENNLRSGENELKIIMMCELPSNAVLADEFLEYFDGFSIGSNDMTQLTLGLDRDSALIADSFDERNEAVKEMLHLSISAAKRQNKYIGICGQGPSDYPELAEWLRDEGIDSLSLNPDSLIATRLALSKQD